MTKDFRFKWVYFRSEPVFLVDGEGHFSLQHSEGRGYLDTYHCHRELALEDQS